MYCQNCGNELNPGAKFCPVCGAKIEAGPEPVHDNGFSKALTILIFSIIGALFGLIPHVSLIGVVFSAIARGMVVRFRKAGFQIGGEGLVRKAKVSGILAKTGSIVSIVGLIVSIAALVLFIGMIVAAVTFGRQLPDQ